MERNVKANVAQGQADSAALRNALKEELIARELMVQESIKRGLNRQAETEDTLFLMRQNVLIDLLMQEEIGKNPITEAELKSEYDRQVKVLTAGDTQQYQLATIVLENEVDARAVMASLRSGQTFESQAKTKSVDPSKERGGELGWLLTDHMTPAISNVVVNLSVGSVSAAPIQMGPFWHVVKLLGKRAYQVPSFENSKGLVQTAVFQNRRIALLKKLQDAAKITR
jgi:peptidyl-prolyl cis-trans isomerase C